MDWAFDWTAFGQLHKATPDTGTAREYTYDAFGRRVSTKVGSQVNEYVYHGWHMVGEWDDTASEWLWQEIPFPVGEGMLEHVALDTNDLDGDLDTSEYRQYAVHEDFQSTVWGISDTSGAIVERYRYREPYGDSYTEDSSATDIGDFASEVFHRKRLHGGFVDEEAELYDFRSRWLIAFEGHWTSRDPEGVRDSQNLCQFVFANPLSWSDPHGRSASPGTKGGIKCPCVRFGNCECPTKARDTLCNDMKALVAAVPKQYRKHAETVIAGLCDDSIKFKCTLTGTGNCPPSWHAATMAKQDKDAQNTEVTMDICMKECECKDKKRGSCWEPMSGDLEQLLLHEMWHGACMLQAGREKRGASDCAKEGGFWNPNKKLDRCGMNFYNCLKSPAKGCAKLTKDCFEFLGMTWY